ncbi:hypothetical protein NBRC116587_09990 [Pseudoteredinibacter isoporae]
MPLRRVLAGWLGFFSCAVGPLHAEVAEIPQVKTAKVKAWQQGRSHALYCVVNTPFVFQADSHSEAELLTILPEGSRVKKGQLVAEQDRFYLMQALGQLEIDQKRAKAELDHAVSEQRRLEVLDQQKLVANAQLNQATLVRISAQLTLEALANDKRTLERRIKRLQHRAPFDAQVLTVSAEPGQQVGQGQTLFQLLPLAHKQLECRLPLDIARELGLLSTVLSGRDTNINNANPEGSNRDVWSDILSGVEFILSHDSGPKTSEGERFHGQLSLSELSQNVDIDTQNLRAYFHYQRLGGAPLLVGQRVKVEIQQRYQDVSRVPYDAVTLAGSSYELWQLNADNTVSKVNPQVISTSKDYFVVRSPLKAGDTVVVRGQKQLQEQQQVRGIGERS